MSEQLTELEDFLEKLNDYEPGIINIIQYYTKTYTFESNKELKDAVNLWNENKDECIKRYGHISDWDTSNITDMSYLFEDKTTFNEDISCWDTSKVTDMNNMFFGAISFNQPLNNWDVSSVTNMDYMFYGAKSFNQPIGGWKTYNVILMRGMFYHASSFNQPLNNWDVSSVTNMNYMFEYCPIEEEHKPKL